MSNEESSHQFRRIGSTSTCKNVQDSYRITSSTTRIGRQFDEVEFYLNSSVNKRLISRHHAQLERIHDGRQWRFILIDTSLNGTYVNDVKVSGQTELKVGDTVTFGHTNGINVRDGMIAWQPNSEFRFVFECVNQKNASKSLNSSDNTTSVSPNVAKSKNSESSNFLQNTVSKESHKLVSPSTNEKNNISINKHVDSTKSTGTLNDSHSTSKSSFTRSNLNESAQKFSSTNTNRKRSAKDVYDFDLDDNDDKPKRIASTFRQSATSTSILSSTIVSPVASVASIDSKNFNHDKTTVTNSFDTKKFEMSSLNATPTITSLSNSSNFGSDNSVFQKSTAPKIASVAPVQTDPFNQLRNEEKRVQKPTQKVLPVSATTNTVIEHPKPTKVKCPEPVNWGGTQSTGGGRKTLNSLSSDFAVDYVSKLTSNTLQEKPKKELSSNTKKVDAKKSVTSSAKHHIKADKEKQLVREPKIVEDNGKEDPMDVIRKAFAGIKPKRQAISDSGKHGDKSASSTSSDDSSDESDDDDDDSSSDSSSTSDSSSSDDDDDDDDSDDNDDSDSPVVNKYESKSKVKPTQKPIAVAPSVRKTVNPIIKRKTKKSPIKKKSKTYSKKRRKNDSSDDDVSESSDSSSEEILPSKTRKKPTITLKQPSVTFTRPQQKKKPKSTVKKSSKKEPKIVQEIIPYQVETCDSIDCLKPRGDTIDWVQCDDCDSWYHTSCVGCSLDVVQDQSASFHCGCT